MYKIDTKLEADILTIYFYESIDSTNADEVERLIKESIGDNKNIVFDFAEVKYISSAGLRIVLKFAKLSDTFEVINVSSDVYEIFDMTGFTQIINIKKGMRVISIENKELIGEGFMGRVYRIDDETIIKVYYRNSTIDDIQREISLAKKAFILGIPTAIPFDMVKVKEGGYGSIFELLKSRCFNKLFQDFPENEDKYVKMYIDLLKEIMKITVSDSDKGNIPSKQKEALSWVDGLRGKNVFSEDVLNQIAIMIESIPDQNHLIHGDFHIKNIMMQGDEPLLIDMDTLGYGHEIFEITAFFLTYIGYTDSDPNPIPENPRDTFLGVPDRVSRRLFYDLINDIYGDRSQEERKQLIDKCALLGYLWLAYKTTIFEPENTHRMNFCKNEVLRLLKSYNTLDF